MPSADPTNTLWSRAGDPRPGPRPGLSLDDIAAVCVRLADGEGLRALSMRRVAEELGTGAASLYRYVSGKDDLVSLMYDRVAGEYEFEPTTGDLRADVLSVAGQARAMYRRHPWMIGVSPAGLGPNGLRYLDHMAAVLAPARLEPAATMTGIAMLSGWVTVFSGQEAAGQVVPAAGGADQIAVLLRHGDYPHLSELFARADAAAGAAVDADAIFRAGIEALLFGIAGGGTVE
ncbi:TetR/AcrR family transcriptional regulator [Nocardia jinanensis]|uniref:TetR family transcriptional regulator n=1 Tax=Nocardia jinanensis TaxID=382504 RepID=A0A917VWI6_9NOCA|nr:TetR/AcrR family transcriptional regulator [Nocardia jinanensis]GGL35735.1 TetR family transcriptional regulator [Nocardia jinanensis]